MRLGHHRLSSSVAVVLLLVVLCVRQGGAQLDNLTALMPCVVVLQAWRGSMDGQRRQQYQDIQHARDTAAPVRRADTAVHWWLATSRPIPQHALQGERPASLCFWFSPHSTA